jgi:hypothetical protein
MDRRSFLQNLGLVAASSAAPKGVYAQMRSKSAMTNIFAGDSITDPATLGTAGIVYAQWFSAMRGENAVNIAQGGSCAADQALAIYANPAASGDKYFFLLGTNDLANRGYGSAALALYSTTILSFLYFMGGVTKTARDPAWSYSGSWTNSAGVGKYSSQVGATASVNFSGDIFAMSYLLSDLVTGTFSVTIDGINKGAFSVVPPAAIHTIAGNPLAPGADPDRRLRVGSAHGRADRRERLLHSGMDLAWACRCLGLWPYPSKDKSRSRSGCWHCRIQLGHLQRRFTGL